MFSTTSSFMKAFAQAIRAGLSSSLSKVRQKHFAFLFVLIFVTPSCSTYISLIDNAPTGLPLKEARPQKLSCHNSDTIASHSVDDNQTLDAVFAKANLSIEEELILAILQQMAVRPATTSPWARLQVGVLKNDQWLFYDYYQHAPSKPLWQGLHDLTIRLKLKPMSYYLKLAEKLFPRTMEIGSPFARYLEKYRVPLVEEISAGPFFKAGQILKSGESIPSLKWSQLPKLLKTTKALSPLQVPVFKSQSFEESNIRCNFDIDLYSKSVYLVRPDPGVNYNVLARTKGKQAFIFISSVELQNPHPIAGSGTLLKQLPALRPAPICLVDREKGHQLLLTSLKGRDPGQHLYNLLQYSISKASKIEEVETYLAFPRHQFLYEPPRMLYESSRGSANNLESFLRLDFPIYHSPSLGEVWAWGQFIDKSTGIAIDERSDASLRCQKR